VAWETFPSTYPSNEPSPRVIEAATQRHRQFRQEVALTIALHPASYCPSHRILGDRSTDDIQRCLAGRCIGRNCPCLCHMRTPIEHEAMRASGVRRRERLRSSGGATLVLEELESALNRGAKIYAEVLGHGSEWGVGVANPPPLFDHLIRP
jgi:hypothetical protein